MWTNRQFTIYSMGLPKSHQLLEANIPPSILNHGISNPPNPRLAILNLGIGTYPTQMIQVVTHILLAARNTILKKWNSQDSPNIFEVISTVHTNHTYEQLLAINSLTCNKFDEQWSFWTDKYGNII